MKVLAVLAVVFVGIVSLACASSSGSPQPTVSPTVVGAAASPTPVISCPSPVPCPGCPEPITCPTCPEPVVCPPPAVCPQCPDPSALLSAYQMSDACTGAKLHMELEEPTGVDAGVSEEFFWKNCQGVPLLEGSRLASACAAGGLTAALVAIPGLEVEGVLAATLIERYCTP